MQTEHPFLYQGKQFSVSEVEVVTAVVDIDEVVSYRGAISSLQDQAAAHEPHPHIHVPFKLCAPTADQPLLPSSPIEPRYHCPEEEIALGKPPILPPSLHHTNFHYFSAILAADMLASVCTFMARDSHGGCVAGYKHASVHVRGCFKSKQRPSQGRHAGCGTTSGGQVPLASYCL